MSKSDESPLPVLPVPPVPFPPLLSSLDSSIDSVERFEFFLSGHPDFGLEINRPWARGLHRKPSGCLGKDFHLEHQAFQLKFYWNEKEQLLCGIVKFSDSCEGPPTGVHGAAIASVFDEILAYPLWRRDEAASVTVQLNVNYREFIPLGSTQAFFSRLREVRGRRAFLEGSLFGFSTGGKIPKGKRKTFSDSVSTWMSAGMISNASLTNVLKREAEWSDAELEEHAKGLYAYGRKTPLKQLAKL